MGGYQPDVLDGEVADAPEAARAVARVRRVEAVVHDEMVEKRGAGAEVIEADVDRGGRRPTRHDHHEEHQGGAHELHGGFPPDAAHTSRGSVGSSEKAGSL